MRLASQRQVFDRSSLAAYIGAGAAIAFIAAMTFGAIDAPSNHGTLIAQSTAPATTDVVAATQPEVGVQVR